MAASAIAGAEIASRFAPLRDSLIATGHTKIFEIGANLRPERIGLSDGSLRMKEAPLPPPHPGVHNLREFHAFKIGYNPVWNTNARPSSR